MALVYSLEHKQFLVNVYLAGSSMREAIDLFAVEYPDSPIPSISAVHKYVRRYQQDGCLNDDHQHGPQRRRRLPYVLTEEMEIRICSCAEIHPHVTSAQISRDCGVSKSSVLKVLKKHGYFPYKVRSGQILKEADKAQRVQMCQQLLDHFQRDPSMKRRILWTDECSFWLDGKRNVPQLRTWSRTNPSVVVPTHSQYQQKVNVWCGMLDDKIIGPFFIEGNMNAVKYQEMLIHQVGPAVTDALGDEDVEIWWQQDGAPPHTARFVREWLNEIFNNRWIGKFSPSILWSPRSPDCTPLDFFFWGYMKSKLYRFERIPNIEELKENILAIAGNIEPDVLRKVTSEGVGRRLQACITAVGDLFEYLLR